MTKKIQSSLFKRAQMHHFYNTGFQMKQFQDGFSPFKANIEPEEDFNYEENGFRLQTTPAGTKLVIF